MLCKIIKGGNDLEHIASGNKHLKYFGNYSIAINN